MTRGYRVCQYEQDSGELVALMVDADSVADANRGWVEIGPGVLPFAPRGFLPRIVVGRDETGRQRRTRVGTVTCDLWTFTVTQWLLEGNDLQLHPVTATNRRGEKQIGPRLSPP